MKNLHFLLISFSSFFLFGMEESVQEPIERELTSAITEPVTTSTIWQILGEQGAPSLKFIQALPLVLKPKEDIKSLPIPEDLKEYVNYLEDEMTQRLIALFNEPLTAENAAKASLLLAAGANPHFLNAQGISPFSWAVISGAPIHLVDLLIKKGADVNVHIDPFNDSLLLRAIIDGKNDIAGLLIDAPKINLEDQNRQGDTALTAAAAAGEADLVKKLIDKKVNINHQDIHGRTALMNAVTNRHEPIVRLLLNAHADTTLKDVAGHAVITWPYNLDLSKFS